ncbi:MAG TPA: hypothetical protein DIC60_04625 [Lachnospiraceae bacterium]|nr:hypothetical protein [Lachnospiraceae bacterium]
MNKETVLGSSFEMSLRILLILNEIENTELDIQRICAIDFIAVYAADFNLLDENLHGYGNYRFSEYTARKDLVTSALKILVLNGTITFLANRNGFAYKITQTGKNVCHDLNDTYSDEYRIAVKSVFRNYDVTNDNAMLKDINQHTIHALQEVDYE